MSNLPNFSPINIATLKRSMGLFAAITLVVSSMIGSGVFKKVAPMTAELGSPVYVLLAWIFAGAISLCGALTNAEVAGMIADPGGQYAYFKKMYGKVFSFFFGWTSFTVIQSATAASVAYVFAQGLNNLVTLPRLPEAIESISLFGLVQPLDNSGVKLVTIGLIALLTVVNYRGVENGSLVSNFLASTVVIAILLIIILGLSLADDGSAHFASVPAKFQNIGTSALISAFFVAMMQAFWAYEGWNNLGFMGGEIKEPHKNIPKALVIGVGTVMLVYVAVNFVYLYLLSPEQLIKINNGENKIAAVEAVGSFLGTNGVLGISLLILLATFGSTNGVLLTAGRLYYKMACDRLFWKQAATVHPTYKTPGNSLIIQGIWSSLLVLSGSFDQLTDMLIFAAFLYYGAMATGVFVLRYKFPETPRPYKAFGYPIVPAFFILFCIVLVGNSIVERPKESLFGLLLMLSGIPFYWFWNGKGNVGEVKS